MYTNLDRLILYFPVSALVTLFGNILQNPQDPRARSDTRLMNLVVGFLSMLNADEENGGVKRMLGVCSEFERIAKVVLDKAEKDTSSRRKRKSNGNDDPKTKAGQIQNPNAPPHTPMMNNSQTSTMGNVFSPNGVHQLNTHQNGYSPSGPNGNGNNQPNDQSNSNNNESSPSTWPQDYPTNPDYLSPTNMTPYTDMQNQSFNDMSPLNGNNFQQPFVPQDLWQMPMTLEWDWADMTGGQYPSFENGIVGDPGLQNVDNSHLVHQPL